VKLQRKLKKLEHYLEEKVATAGAGPGSGVGLDGHSEL
jgi:hypothetical protein